MTHSDGNSISQQIIRYHEETKHHYDRYARSAGSMDWDNQPNPFRFYEDTKSLGLPFLKKDPPALYADLYRRDNNLSRGFRIVNIAGFLELSLGLSAWKAAGESQWSLRINPSSGNLHPTEAHGIRGTGIGCFFDDAVHEILGFTDNQYQSLYHFTIGKPAEDPRLTTYPPYHHLSRQVLNS